MFNQTEVSLCNRALGILGVERQITSITEPDPQNAWSKRCAEIWRPTLITTLAKLMPTFAITPRPVRIPQTTDGRWLIPADSVKILSVNGMSGDDIHEIGGEIILDFPAFDKTIEVEYIRLIEKVGLWSPEFQELYPYELAVKLATYLSDSGKLATATQLRDRMRAETGGLNAQRIRMRRRNKPLWKHKWAFPMR